MIEMARDVRRFSIDGERDLLNDDGEEKPIFHPKSQKFFFYVKNGVERRVIDMLKEDGMLAIQHNAMSETPLIISAQKDYFDIVKILLEYGANVHARD